MVALDLVKASNALIGSNLPSGLVVVVTGGTSGIGEVTLKTLAKYLEKPRIYLVGRSQASADRIIAECRTLNSDAEYIFIQKALDLMKSAAEAIEEIKAREKKVNILILSAGGPDLSRTITEEGLHRIQATNLFARILFTQRLLPLLRAGAPELARVVSVLSGTNEGPINPSDWQVLKSSVLEARGQGSSLTTISLRKLAEQAPEVSFIHQSPGLVITPALNVMTGFVGVLARIFVFLFGRWAATPLEESGERHSFLATSALYPAKEAKTNGVVLDGVKVKSGVDGVEGSGVYSVHSDGEGPPEKVIKLLKGYREDGMEEKAWEYMTGELTRVLGPSA